MSRRWTNEVLDRIEAVFRRHVRYDDAFAEVNATIASCNAEQLRGAFRWADPPRSAPMKLLGQRPDDRAHEAQPVVEFCEPEIVQTAGAYTGAPPPDFDDPVTPLRDTVRVVAPFVEERILVVPDSHWPYVDEDAWAMLLRVGRFLSPHRIIVLGDFLDCYAVSFHSKTAARRANLAEEIAASGRGWDDLDSLGAGYKHALHGNHEHRTVRYINERAPELHGIVGLTIEEMFRLPERGWTSSKYLKEHHLGDWRMSHDYGDAGPYALKRAVEVTDSNTIIGHTHRLAEHVGVAKRDGRTIRGMSFGWLGSFDEIDYMHRAKARRDWAHACGVGFTRPDGSIRFEAVRFAGTETRVDGQRVAA